MTNRRANKTLKEYLAKEYPEQYINQMINYYKKSFADHIMQTDQELTSYRKKLLGLVNETMFIDSTGKIVEDKFENNDKNNAAFGNVMSDSDGSGLVLFCMLQYEHDFIMDSYQEKHNTNDFDFCSLFNGPICSRHRSYEKHELFSGKKESVQENRTVVNFEELFFKYGYRSYKSYSGLCSWNGEKFLIQLKTCLKNPLLPLLENFLTNGNINIRIVSKTVPRVVTTLSGTKHVCVDETGWTLDVED